MPLGDEEVVETGLGIIEQIAAGIAVAKRRGVYRGRAKGTTKANPPGRWLSVRVALMPQRSRMHRKSVPARSFGI
jgi:hypothetical protein